MKKTHIREKRIICGSRYMEVDIYQITERQYKAARASKKKPSRPAQQRLNEKNSRRYLLQLVNTNFTPKDTHLSPTYSDKFMPKSDEEALQNKSKYIRRINDALKRRGLPPAKYIAVTEIQETKDKRGKRYHHHIIISCGLSRDELEFLWSIGPPWVPPERRERIGTVNADRLQFDNDSLEALCKYIISHPSRKRRWSQSKGLKMPKKPKPADNKYKRRSFERAAKTGDFYDKDFVRKQYPEWEYNDAEVTYNEITGWAVYLKMRRNE